MNFKIHVLRNHYSSLYIPDCHYYIIKIQQIMSAHIPSGYSCLFCSRSVDSASAHMSEDGELACPICVSSKSNFQYVLSSLLEKIPTKFQSEQLLISDAKSQVIEVRSKVRELQQRITAQMRQFKQRIECLCECVEMKIQTYINKVEDYQKAISDLANVSSTQVKKIVDFLKHHKFQPDKYRFNITKDVKQLVLKSKTFQTVSLNLPDLQKTQEEIKVISISDTIISNLKIIGDRIVAGTVSGEIIVRDKMTPQKGFKIVGHEGMVRSMDIYKDMLVTASKQIKIWKMNESNLQLIRTFGVMPLMNYRQILVIEDQGMVITCCGGNLSSELKLWSLQSSVVINILEGHTDIIKGMVRGKDNQVVTMSADNTIRIWDIQNRCLMRTIFHQNKLLLMDYDPRLNLIVVFDSSNWVTLYGYGFSDKAVVVSKWRLSRFTTTLMVDQYSRLVTSKAEQIRVFDIYGQKMQEKHIDKSELKSMILEYDRVWGGTGRGELICTQLIGNCSLFV